MKYLVAFLVGMALIFSGCQLTVSQHAGQYWVSPGFYNPEHLSVPAEPDTYYYGIPIGPYQAKAEPPVAYSPNAIHQDAIVLEGEVYQDDAAMKLPPPPPREPRKKTKDELLTPPKRCGCKAVVSPKGDVTAPKGDEGVYANQLPSRQAHERIVPPVQTVHKHKAHKHKKIVKKANKAMEVPSLPALSSAPTTTCCPPHKDANHYAEAVNSGVMLIALLLLCALALLLGAFIEWGISKIARWFMRRK